MLDPHSRGVLQEVVRREGRSLLQYVSEAFPWARPEDEQSVVHLKQLAHQQSEAIAGITRFLKRHNAAVPYLGAFPASFTSANFVTLDYLRPLLAKHAEKEIALLEKDLGSVTDAEARSLLSDLLALKRLQREDLATATWQTSLGPAAKVH